MPHPQHIKIHWDIVILEVNLWRPNAPIETIASFRLVHLGISILQQNNMPFI